MLSLPSPLPQRHLTRGRSSSTRCPSRPRPAVDGFRGEPRQGGAPPGASRGAASPGCDQASAVRGQGDRPSYPLCWQARRPSEDRVVRLPGGGGLAEGEGRRGHARAPRQPGSGSARGDARSCWTAGSSFPLRLVALGARGQPAAALSTR